MTRREIQFGGAVEPQEDDDLAALTSLVRARGGCLGQPMHRLATTTSTNDEAHRGAKDGAPHGAIWVAEEQTAGRGRRGRTWVSPAGEGLLFSLLLRLSCPPARLPPLALLAGLAVREAVGRAAPRAEMKIKWPNDVIVRWRKIAGVLVEACTVGSRVEAVIIGIGINVRTRSFPADLEDRATSVALEAEGGAPGVRAVLLADVLTSIERDLAGVLASGVGFLRPQLDAADGLRGRRVRNDTGDTGVASGIDDEGRLLVVLDSNVLARWSAGEVQLVREAPCDDH